MIVRELVEKNRSYRRFHQDSVVGEETLRGLIGLARLAASAANLQPLRYMTSSEKDKNSLVFPTLKWAGYLKDWPGPSEGERPAAYIIVLGDLETSKDFGCDHGIAAENILLGAVEAGLGGCIISSVDRTALSSALRIPERYEILMVIALGRPKETVQVEKVAEDGDVRYWRDENGEHHVPKRALDDIILDFNA